MPVQVTNSNKKPHGEGGPAAFLKVRMEPKDPKRLSLHTIYLSHAPSQGLSRFKQIKEFYFHVVSLPALRKQS